jgi:hypothetical protein
LAAVFLDFPEGKVRVRSKLAPKGGLVHAEDQFRHLPRGKPAQGFFIVRTEGLPPDPSLHLQGLGLQTGKVLVGVHLGPVARTLFAAFFAFTPDLRSWQKPSSIAAQIGQSLRALSESGSKALMQVL